jgi:chromosome partitioning protein
VAVLFGCCDSARPVPHRLWHFGLIQPEVQPMPVVVIVNPKGGCGKSTLATQVAGLFARDGHSVMLGDVDPQQSSRQWLAVRPAGVPPIASWDTTTDAVLRPPKGVTHVVLDTPAGLDGARLDAVLGLAHRLLVPVQASLFDIQATHAFVHRLRAHPLARRLPIGLVAMRVKDHTRAADRLDEYLASLSLPVLAHLRDTQNYVHMAAQGLTLWDVTPSRVQRDLDQWEGLAHWLRGSAAAQRRPGTSPEAPGASAKAGS